MDIRQFALPSRHALLDHFATVSFEGIVTTWSFLKRSMLSSFQTCYDFGGSRVAVSTDSRLLLTASFERGLIEQHTFDGISAWTVSMMQPQRVTWLEAIGCWCVTTESNEAHLLDTGGRELMSIKGIERLISLDGHHSLAVHADSMSVLDGRMRPVLDLAKVGFGVLDAVRYTKSDLAVAFAGGLLKRYSLFDGDGAKLELPTGLPQTLAATTAQELYAQIDVPGESRQLVRLSTAGQQFAEVLTLPWQSGRGLFAESGKYFLSHHTGVWDVERPAQAWVL